MKQAEPVPLMGWKEWVSLPGLGIRRIRAKVDTGAKTSALHATDIRVRRIRGKEWVEFTVRPLRKRDDHTISTRALLVEFRWITTSLGHRTRRPVVRTELILGTQNWSIELTLVDRGMMGHRMLLGREALRKRFRIDPGRAYIITNKKKRKTMRKTKSERQR